MGFTLIKGAFHLDAGNPDGDSVRFKADDDRQFESLRGRRVEFKTDGTVQLRYEGIDTIEKAAIQPLAMESRDKNFEFLRRPVSFAFSGEIAQPDGADLFLDGPLIKRSVNYKMVESGFAYTMFYETLFMEIRSELAAAFVAARVAKRALHQNDATLIGVEIKDRSDLAIIPPIFPKLWRRLEEYFRNHSNLADFIDWLAARDSEKLSTLSDQRTAISLDNVVEVQGNTIRLLYSAEDMVFRPS
jgi:endonuclease YncB( thermonuclease family)